MTQIPWGPVGYLTYKRTYSRRLDAADANSPTEEYEDTVNRIIEACDSQLGMVLYHEEKQAIRKIHLQMKGSVAGRFLWQLGSPTVDKLGLFSLQNCAGIVVDSPIEPFTWTMDALMLGSGVGYNIQKEHIYSLPKLKGPVEIVRKDTPDADFIVPDSREGWVELLRRVLHAHWKTGKGFSYSTMLVRGKGAAIKGFGGLASGPEELCWGMAQINKLLNSRAKKKLNPIDALDLMNIIGYVVVAGNVRRSAQLAIGDFDDMQYLNAKRWDLGGIPNWRAMSNNSVVCNEFGKLPDQFWQGYQGNGEPYGLINLKLSQTVGRTGETQYPDQKVMVYNPCLTGDTLINTSEGPRQIKDLVGKEVKIYDGEKWVTNSSFRITQKRARLYRVFLKYNGTIHCIRTTPSHRWYCTNGIQTVSDYLIPGAHQIEACVGYAEVVGVVKDLQEYEEVYCTTVESTGKFLLANGIMTGNCAEQSLEDGETCALAEVFLPNAESEEDLFNTVSYLYKIVKHSLALKCHQPLTEKVVHQNMRMGIGMTGIMQARAEQLEWLPRVYEKLRELDVAYSKLHSFNPSIKLTTIKPSGTMSLLPGVTPGCHPGFSQYYTRRIRVAANSPLINVCISHGYHVEPQYNFDGTTDQNTFVVSFPCAYPPGTKLANQVSALEQLDTVRWLQKNWSDNAVSCTVYYQKAELPGIQKYLAKHYDQEIKTCSFLLHQDHGFKQAPYEEISEDEYLSRKSLTRPITSLSTDTSVIESDCEGGACPVR
jgi:hypothetical protein